MTISDHAPLVGMHVLEFTEGK